MLFYVCHTYVVYCKNKLILTITLLNKYNSSSPNKDTKYQEHEQFYDIQTKNKCLFFCK